MNRNDTLRRLGRPAAERLDDPARVTPRGPSMRTSTIRWLAGVLALSGMVGAVAMVMASGSALAPEPVKLSASLSATSGATAAVVLPSKDETLAYYWPARWLPNYKLLAEGTPCSSVPLKAGQVTTEVIILGGDGRYARCASPGTASLRGPEPTVATGACVIGPELRVRTSWLNQPVSDPTIAPSVTWTFGGSGQTATITLDVPSSQYDARYVEWDLQRFVDTGGSPIPWNTWSTIDTTLQGPWRDPVAVPTVEQPTDGWPVCL